MAFAIILLAKLIIAFVMISGFVMNCFSAKAEAEFVRLGYPGWFRHVTGILEAGVGVAIFVPAIEQPALILGAVVMLAAVISLARFREWLHALPAFVVMGLCIGVAFSDKLA